MSFGICHQNNNAVLRQPRRRARHLGCPPCPSKASDLPSTKVLSKMQLLFATVIAQIFVRDLISYISYFWRKARNLVAYENHTVTYTIVSDTTVAVRKFIAYESRQTLEYEIFTRTKISAITVLWPFHLTPSRCRCGVPFDIDHVMSCSQGGFQSLRHNETRDLLTGLFAEVCSDVCVEPPPLATVRGKPSSVRQLQEG